jgi:hypothetical protein
VAKRQANGEYGTSYLRRFLSKAIDGGLAATASPNKVVQVLPDRWKVAFDANDEGEAKKFPAADFDDSKWKEAATYSGTLSLQGLDSNSVIWYRTKLKAPDGRGPLSLVFPEVDGRTTTVFVNGKAIDPEPVLKPAAKPKPKAKGAKTAAPAKPDAPPKPAAPAVGRRAPFEVNLEGALQPGENTIAVRVDNRTISELFLGGILRPVVLIEKPK